MPVTPYHFGREVPDRGVDDVLAEGGINDINGQRNGGSMIRRLGRAEMPG